jgi:branched-chain amino acid transport system ATP-binding protein
MGSTLVRTILDVLAPSDGVISFEGANLAGLPPFRIARRGIGLVPEGRLVCVNLTVEESLRATARPTADSSGWTLGSVYKLFPQLQKRKTNFGNQLSGGKQ